jgi:hypothetical protein
MVSGRCACGRPGDLTAEKEQFARAWAEGQAMTLAQAVAYALEDEPEPLPGTASF